jgi:hypothetical protein
MISGFRLNRVSHDDAFCCVLTEFFPCLAAEIFDFVARGGSRTCTESSSLQYDSTHSSARLDEKQTVPAYVFESECSHWLASCLSAR